MNSPRALRKADAEFAARLAAQYEVLTLKCVARMNHAHAEAVRALYRLAGSQDLDAISDEFEKILHAGIQEALGMLPPIAITRSEFDALPVLPEGDDSSGRQGLCRKQIRAHWVIIDANYQTGVLFRPDILDGRPPLH
jgi:hypothetical protein